MNPQMQTQAERSTSSDITVNDTDLLAGWDSTRTRSPRCSGYGSGTRTAAATALRWCVTWNFSACWFTAVNSNCRLCT
jgi:hypothetical protein